MTKEEREKAIAYGKEQLEVFGGEHAEFIKLAIEDLEQEPVLEKVRADIIKYECNCRLSVDEYPTCKQCTDNVFESIYGIIDKYKAESEV